ncbi:hypothetical protein GQ600_8388 [Phytophthora cactorum]|nr:hypothetical protein GQ600_8388 [Phytophthora cactorum]
MRGTKLESSLSEI